VSTILQEKPVGWWYFDKRPHGGGWIGPFDTDVAALKTAKQLVSVNQTEIELLCTAAWDHKVIRVEKVPND